MALLWRRFAPDDDDDEDNNDDDDDANDEEICYRGDELLGLLLKRRCHCVHLNLIRDLVRDLSSRIDQEEDNLGNEVDCGYLTKYIQRFKCKIFLKPGCCLAFSESFVHDGFSSCSVKNLHI